MTRFWSGTSAALEQRASGISARVQRLEAAHAALRAEIEGERNLRLLAAHVVAAAEAAPIIGAALQQFALAMRTPMPHGRAGGLARARSAWRYLDGTFMPEWEKDEAYRAEYDRYARGGRARAASARRASDGTFQSRGSA